MKLCVLKIESNIVNTFVFGDVFFKNLVIALISKYISPPMSLFALSKNKKSSNKVFSL